MKKMLGILLCVFVIIGVSTIWYHTCWWAVKKVVRCTERTEGIVIDLHKSFSSGRNRTISPIVEYYINDKPIKGLFNYSGLGYKVGDKVIVYYNPDNQDFYLGNVGYKWITILPAIFGIFLIVATPSLVIYSIVMNGKGAFLTPLIKWYCIISGILILGVLGYLIFIMFYNIEDLLMMIFTILIFILFYKIIKHFKSR